MTQVQVDTVKSMFPGSAARNIERNFRDVATAFDELTAALDKVSQQTHAPKLTNEEKKQLELFMYATVRAENASFSAKNEVIGSSNSFAFNNAAPVYDKYGNVNGVRFTPTLIPPTSRYTLLGQPFGLYEIGKRRHDMKNEYGDGERYKGRGYIQLTGHENYRKYSKTIPGLEQNPSLAENNKNAAKILVAYILDHRKMIIKSLESGDLSAARSVVNGKPKAGFAPQGLKDFISAFNAGTQHLAKKSVP